MAGRIVEVDGDVVEMTAKEFDVLAFLAAHRGAGVQPGGAARTGVGLVAGVAGPRPDPVTVHVRRIRQKIEDDPQDPRWVTTVWGVGYRFAL